MESILLVLHFITMVCLAVIILLRGGEADALFGSSTDKGYAPKKNLIFKVTSVFAVIFFITTLSLDYMQYKKNTTLSNALLSTSMPVAPTPLAPSSSH